MKTPNTAEIIQVLATPSGTIRLLGVVDPWDVRVLRFMRDEATQVSALARLHHDLVLASIEAMAADDLARDEVDETLDDEAWAARGESEICWSNPAGHRIDDHEDALGMARDLMGRLLRDALPEHIDDDCWNGIHITRESSWLAVLGMRLPHMVDAVLAARVPGWIAWSDERTRLFDFVGMDDEWWRDEVCDIAADVWREMPRAARMALSWRAFPIFGCVDDMRRPAPG